MIRNRDISARWAWFGVLALWLVCVIWLSLWLRENLLTVDFSDPDDAMRLVQVRDWMAGQSWFDVTQYRSQPPMGASMHWSRLVDLPIAGMIALAGLVLPPAMAQQVALLAVPILLLLALFVLVYKLTLLTTGHRITGVMAALLLMLSMGVLAQFCPLRIDHHGWQMVLGAVSVILLLRALEGSRRAAVLAGLASALALEIAIEGLPLAVAMAGVLAFRHLRDGRSAHLLLGYLAALTGGAALLPLAMLGWPAVMVPWCDALSPAYLLPIAAATSVLAIGLRLLPQERTANRLAVLMLAGLAAAVVFRLATPQCAAGPFSTLDPIVYRDWYSHISEGLPIWRQDAEVLILVPVPSLFGLFAVLWAIRTDRLERREQWIALLILQSVTFLLSLLVMRAMGMAHVLAIPASAWLLFTIFAWTRSFSTSWARIVTGVAWIAIMPFSIQSILLSLTPQEKHLPAGQAYSRTVCAGRETLAGLRALPTTTLFAELDIAPMLLAHSRHSVIATGHHRARQGMKTVITGMTAPPEQARRIMMGTRATHLVFCAGENDIQTYAKLYPASITAALLKGRTPAWLQRVPLPPGESVRVYHILRSPMPAIQPLAPKRSATPFMQ
ncbi:MAG TPA: hypothetical protein VF463_01205 [Sphingobium sp.]